MPDARYPAMMFLKNRMHIAHRAMMDAKESSVENISHRLFVGKFKARLKKN